MLNISKRLKAIADLVDTKKVIDVGCDHGYLYIYLTIYKDCHCIATDISKNAIKNCIDNINLYNLKDKIEVIVTDGINGIKINKEDTIVLSGMGTQTIIDILTNQNLSNNIIISSNNHLEELRKFMVKIGYYIDNEVYIVEHNIHYVIIKFKKGIRVDSIKGVSIFFPVKSPKGLKKSAGDKLFFFIEFFAFSELYTKMHGLRVSDNHS